MLSLEQEKGKYNEDRALKFFKDQGYQLLDRNKKLYDVEFDLILKKSKTVYLIEVKSNNVWRSEHPLSYSQKSRLKEAACMWGEEHQCSVRLLLAVVGKDGKIQVFSLDG